MRFIAEGFKRKLTATEIEDGLSHMFSRNIEVNEQTATTTAVVQQQSENELKHYTEQLQIALKQMSNTMQIIADQKEEITELRKYVADVERKQQEQQIYIKTKLEDRDQKLMESLREIQEVKKEIASSKEKKKQGFFSKWFS